MNGENLQSTVAKALYTLHHLTVLPVSQNPVILNHFLPLQSSSNVELPKPKVKDLFTNKWESPWELCTWGYGCACVSTDADVQWEAAQGVYCALDPDLGCN